MTFKRFLSLILTVCTINLNFSYIFQVNAKTVEQNLTQLNQINSDNQDNVQTSQSPNMVNIQNEKMQILIDNKTDFSIFMTTPEYWTSNCEVLLTRNIDMEGAKFKPIKNYSGVFDGRGYTLSNFSIQDNSTGGKNIDIAFIKTLDEFAEIKNITFDNYDIYSKSDINNLAGLVLTNYGDILGVNINNVNINDIATKQNASGFIETNFGKITKCSTNLSVNAKNVAGGFIGENFGTVKECSSIGNVSGNKFVGGFCAVNSSEISSCESESNIMANAKRGIAICGGFIGENSGIIKDCNFKGEVTGQAYVGSFVGINNDEGDIINCQSIGNVKSCTWIASIYCGGFVGLNGGKIEDCSSKGKVYGLIDDEKILAVTVIATLALIAIICIVAKCIENKIESNKLTTTIDQNQSIDSRISQYRNNGQHRRVTHGQLSRPDFNAINKPRKSIKNCLLGTFDDNSSNIFNNVLASKQKFNMFLILFGIIGGVTLGIASGAIIGVASGYAFVAGFCGNNFGEISRCSADINLLTAETLYNKRNMCGGFVGANGKIGIIKDSNATGNAIFNKTYTGGFMGGFVGDNIGKIENGITNISISNGKCTGGFCGNNTGEISGSKSEGNAASNAKTVRTTCGGFVGNNKKGKISNCTSKGNVKGEEYVGGFVGINNSEINGCNSAGKATAKTKIKTALAGGFVGENGKGTIISCEATGGADSQSRSGQAKTGGFVGINKANIIDSKASGYVYLSAGTCHTDDGCSGFVGINDKYGNIDGCYADCIIETPNKKKGGGFVGEAKNKSKIINSKCKTKIVTKTGLRSQTKFCQHKYQGAVI